MQALLIPIMVILTSYQPIAAQTDDTPTWTSIGDRTTKYGCAVSRDLLKSKRVKYGDVIYIPGFGSRVVNDTMGETKCVEWRNHTCMRRVEITNAVDMLVFTHEEEKKVGERHMMVFKLEVANKK